MGMVWRNLLDREGVVEVHCKLVVLLYNMVDWGDIFVVKEVEGEVESFVGSVGMGDCYSGVMDGCEVVLKFPPKGVLHFLGMAGLLQGVCPLDW